MSLATTFTKDKILELLSNAAAAVDSVYLKKGDATGVVAGKVPTANGDDTYTWQSLPIVWMTVVDPATDVRPAGTHVLWVGGTTAPTNMTAADGWVPAP